MTFLKRMVVSLAAAAPALPFWVPSVMMSTRVGFVEAFGYTVVSLSVAALLGLGVWEYCERTPWAIKHTSRFYLRHLMQSLAFGVSWVFIECAINSARYRENMFAFEIRSPNLGWQVFMGMWIYVMY